MAFSGGLVLDEHWLVGLELAGLGLQAGDYWDPTEGRALSDTFFITEYHPSLEGGWYLHAGAGLLKYWNNAIGAGQHEGSGPGMRLGVGYEWPAGERWHWGILAPWTTGTIEAVDNWRADAIALSVVASRR